MIVFVLLYLIAAIGVTVSYMENLHRWAVLVGIFWLPIAAIGALVLPIYIVWYTQKMRRERGGVR